MRIAPFALLALLPLVACGGADPVDRDDQTDTDVTGDQDETTDDLPTDESPTDDFPTDTDPLDTTPPTIEGVLPAAYQGLRGPTAVTIVATDAESDIASVTVGSTAAARATGSTWSAPAIGTGVHTITVTNGDGLTATREITIEPLPKLYAYFTRLAAGPDGTMFTHGAYPVPAIFSFDPATTPQITLVSGDGRGSGPAIPFDVSGLAFVNDTLFVAGGNSSGGVSAPVYAIDRATGDRTLVASCTLPGSTFAFAAVSATEFYFYVSYSNQGLYRCGAGEDDGELVATVPFTVNSSILTMAYDAADDRMLVGLSNGAEVSAVALADGGIEVISADDDGGASSAIQGITVVGGEIYYVTEYELRRATPDLAGEALAQLGFVWDATGLAACGLPAGDLCVLGDDMLRLSNQGAPSWSVTQLPTDYPVNEGTDAYGPAWFRFPDDDVFGSALFVSKARDLRRLVISTGEESVITDQARNFSLDVLPSGTFAVGGPTGLITGNLLAAPVTVEATPVTSVRFALVPAGTRAAGEALVYVATGEDLRMRALDTGEDSLLVAWDTYIDGITADDQGTVYAGSGGDIYRNTPGSDALTPMGDAPAGNVRWLAFDDRNSELITSDGQLCHWNVVTDAKGCVSYGPGGGTAPIAPGPFPGTVLGAAYYFDDALIYTDVELEAYYILSR